MQKKLLLALLCVPLAHAWLNENGMPIRGSLGNWSSAKTSASDYINGRRDRLEQIAQNNRLSQEDFLEQFTHELDLENFGSDFGRQPELIYYLLAHGRIEALKFLQEKGLNLQGLYEKSEKKLYKPLFHYLTLVDFPDDKKSEMVTFLGPLFKDEWTKADQNGDTMLHVAARIGCPCLTKLALEHGVDINAQNSRGETALHQATTSNSKDVFNILVERTDLSVQDQNGDTPMQCAIKVRNQEKLQALLDLQAPQIKNNKEQTPRDLLHAELKICETTKSADPHEQAACNKELKTLVVLMTMLNNFSIQAKDQELQGAVSRKREKIKKLQQEREQVVAQQLEEEEKEEKELRALLAKKKEEQAQKRENEIVKIDSQTEKENRDLEELETLLSK